MRNRILVVLSLAGCLMVGAAVPAQAALRPMKEKGTGEHEAEPCGDFICFVFTADANGKPIDNGTFKGVIRLPDTAPVPNNKGRLCRPADGSGTFKRGVHTIKASFEGSACLASKGSKQTRMRAYATITGGTGDFSQAKGAGGLLINFVYQKGTHPLSYSWDGTIKGNTGAG